jgi:hypothetical protein
MQILHFLDRVEVKTVKHFATSIESLSFFCMKESFALSGGNSKKNVFEKWCNYGNHGTLVRGWGNTPSAPVESNKKLTIAPPPPLVGGG